MYAGMLRARLFEERVRELSGAACGLRPTRVAGPSIPIPFSPPLQAFATPRPTTWSAPSARCSSSDVPKGACHA